MADLSSPVGSVGRLAIVAGGGMLPVHLANAARQNGENPFVIVLQAESDLDWSGFEHLRAATGDFAALQHAIESHGIERVVLSGWVRRRPEWHEIRPTRKTVMRLPKIVRTLIKSGDDKTLRMIMGLIESVGATVVGAQDIAPDLVAETGALTQATPGKRDVQDIAAARQAALALGRLDIGQAAVAVGGRVVALEGAEGTDAMLRRVAEMRAEGRISRRRKGVLVKFCKPQQDERADLPSIGPQTIEGLGVARLAGVALEAGRALILERAETLREAGRAGVFIVGVPRDEGT